MINSSIKIVEMPQKMTEFIVHATELIPTLCPSLREQISQKISKIHFKINVFSGGNAKIPFKMLKIDEIFTEIAFENPQIAPKHPENEVLSPKIRSETVLHH